MKRFAFILGKNPDLSLAELSAFFGEKIETPKSKICAFIDTDLEITQDSLNKLGGTMEILEIFEAKVGISKIEEKVTDYLKIACTKKTGKCSFGVNLLPESKKSAALKTLLPRIKKNLREAGISSIFINNNFQNVNDVFAFKHGVHKSGTGVWIIDIGDNEAALGFSIAAQDFEAYSKRDYEKPFRDANTGMLPPKLAQMMVNLGNGRESIKKQVSSVMDDRVLSIYNGSTTYNLQPTHYNLILDPFCGTGTVLMEAMLMGYSVIGSDKNIKLVEGAKKNIDWLKKNFSIAKNVACEISQKDACTIQASSVYNLSPPQRDPAMAGQSTTYSVITEPYLGPPLSTFPAENFLKKLIEELSGLYLNFFKNLATWLPKSSSVVFIFPYWKKGNEKIRSSEKLINSIESYGFKKDLSLFYDRQNQVVGREIVKFIFK